MKGLRPAPRAMESFLNRYRNITVLLLVIFAQLVLLAAQVKNAQDTRMIRVWAVTAVTPVARVAEWLRGGSVGFVRHYMLMKDATDENRRLRDEVGRLRIENTFLKNEVNTADRAKALQLFQTHTPSKMLAANVLMTGVGSNANVVFVNRGSNDGVMRGMGVVTPDGIVGKVVATYPSASQVMLISDPEFAVAVVSQKTQSRGILKGQGSNPLCKVDYVPFEEKIEVGEVFYTSGDDRVFPRGFAVGVVKVVRPGTPFKEVQVEPSGIQHGVEDVLIVMESVHQVIPDVPPANQPIYIAPPPPANSTPAPVANGEGSGAPAQPAGTEADKLRTIYQEAGDAQKHVYGAGLPGSKPPDFTKLPTEGPAAGGRGGNPTPGAAGRGPGAGAGNPPAANSAGSGEPKPYTVRAPNPDNPAPRMQRQTADEPAEGTAPRKSAPAAEPAKKAPAPGPQPAAPGKAPGKGGPAR